MEQKETWVKGELAESEIGKLSHELTYHKYLFNNDRILSFLKKLSIPEYLALHLIQETELADDIYAGRTYLKDIADKMQRTVRQTSRMVKGTYVTITDTGRRMLEEEETALKQYYGKVITSYGRENLIQLLQLMKQLETVISTESEELEGTAIEEQGTDE